MSRCTGRPGGRPLSSHLEKDSTDNMSDRRTYVLDTSVLLAAGSQSLRAFEEHEVVLPLVCVTELESRRNDPEIGWIAREVLRALEDLRLHAAASGTSLRNADGAAVNTEGGTLRIELNHVDQSRLPDAIRNLRTHDARILAVAHSLAAELSDREVVVVSRDLPMRLLAGGALGLRAEDYRHDQAPDSGYSGIERLEVTSEAMNELYSDGSIDGGGDIAALPVHTGVIVTSAKSSSALATVADTHGTLVRLRHDQEAYGIGGRSAEQRVALSHLLDPDIGIVSLGGRAGTGKTLLALAAGLEAVLNRRTQERIVVFRPMYSVGGQDLGFLPGSEEEKMAPWAAAVYDALDVIAPEARDRVEYEKQVEVLPLTHIRGRTLTNTWVILDEAQNLERAVLLSALSRLGEGSKVVLCSDVAQRDNLHVGRHDGIATVVEKLKGEPLFAHVTLTRSERSPVAELVTRLLDTA